ncbi:two-component system, chemotaxis family, sensor kinase CheA [Peptoclostridium litorale DSM 5388]|uniref:Chemotaxis protein CheA n=1 Tax=Peptoclostridium litorale DSM 5388 TaxID=1121324 RepID=A0A069RCS1_PEPLI|nr:chemotaxis protein CheA [Peptoclostridium litorale]KDR94558.1 chemotaxis protein CheA [Peptoclostridium litorale DSM 5388]SIO31374.1 two-component system, chemotaxis family, sensor kinase CheA [Peptoclostridium litorale DSM 5388]
MSDEYSKESMIDIYIFETTQILEQLEQAIMDGEQSNEYTTDAINEIFRLMHTIKGSSAMMSFDNITSLAHSVEDLFFILRDKRPDAMDCSTLSDIVFESIDFIKVEIEKIKSGDDSNEHPKELIERIRGFLESIKGEDGGNKNIESRQDKDMGPLDVNILLKEQQETDVDNQDKNHYRAKVFFEDGCQMENVRAYTIIHNLKDMADEILHFPKDIIEDESSGEQIKKDGFEILMKTGMSYDEVHAFFGQVAFLKELSISSMENTQEFEKIKAGQQTSAEDEKSQDVKMDIGEKEGNADKKIRKEAHSSSNQKFISVNVSKLDQLMDLVGEMVVAEAMVTQNPDVKALEFEGFEKASRHLNKITSELQDVVMSMRMVPLSNTFFKMNRILRDMCKKLSKDAQLEVVGEDTEVDKNIIEHISDPLMHLIRNSMDHGIESSQERIEKDKPQMGTITLEARNEGSDVVIAVKDDGKGLDKERILKKAREKGLLQKPESEMSDTEAYNLIFMPGFSTKENVSQFSGRGVGMDVVTKNIEAVGGSISVYSVRGEGSSVVMKIPLTLAIIDGMTIRVGSSRYTVPVTAIRESFRAEEKDIIRDPGGNEMIMVRGNCYPVVRLHEIYGLDTYVNELTKGIMVMVEQRGRFICIFADELMGQQQVVVKGLPTYIKRNKTIKGIAGCTLLGDGSISLILNVEELAGNVT